VRGRRGWGVCELAVEELSHQVDPFFFQLNQPLALEFVRRHSSRDLTE
jgi:hypothetical protein